MIADSPDGTKTLSADVPLYRVYEYEFEGKPREPVFFCNDGYCRFDLVHRNNAGDVHFAEDGGTAYWSTDPAGAVVEKFFRRKAIVSRRTVGRYRMAKAEVTSDLLLLNLTARCNFGLRGITDGRWDDDEDYSAAQQIALNAYYERLDGIWYPSRRDPARSWISVAVFAPTAGPGDGSILKSTVTDPLPYDLLDEVRDEFGIMFEDKPW